MCSMGLSSSHHAHPRAMVSICLSSHSGSMLTRPTCPAGMIGGVGHGRVSSIHRVFHGVAGLWCSCVWAWVRLWACYQDPGETGNQKLLALKLEIRGHASSCQSRLKPWNQAFFFLAALLRFGSWWERASSAWLNIPESFCGMLQPPSASHSFCVTEAAPSGWGATYEVKIPKSHMEVTGLLVQRNGGRIGTWKYRGQPWEKPLEHHVS